MDFSRIHHQRVREQCCPIFETATPEFARWRATNVSREQSGYSIVEVTVPQGDLASAQMNGFAQLSDGAMAPSGSRCVKTSTWHGFQMRALERVYAALAGLGLNDGGAGEISDVVTYRSL